VKKTEKSVKKKKKKKKKNANILWLMKLKDLE